VIVELPLVTGEDIVAEFRPGGGITVKAALRRLREQGLISAGLTEHPRASVGRIAGAMHLYSALNVDAARAARSDEVALARELAKAASRVEHLRRTAQVVHGLASLGGQTTLRRRFEWAASLEPSLRDSLRAIAEETVATRSRLVHGDPRDPPRLGLVTKLHDELAELQIEGVAAPVPIPTADLAALDSAFVGALLALRFEPFGRGQTLIKSAPAIRIDGDGDEGRIYPYERPLPDATGAVALAGALAAEPTIRRPRRIEIAGRR
jgi:hypothetical protein